MNKLLKSVLLFIFIGLFCGCIGGNDLTNSEEDKRPDIFVKNCYKDYHNVIKGEQIGYGMNNDKYERYTYLPYFVCENGEDYYYVINNSVYKYSNNTSELLFSAEENIFALVGVYEENLYYTSQYSLWKYDIQKDVSEKVFDDNLSHFDTLLFENYLIVKDNISDILYIYNIENDKKITIEDYLTKDFDEMNQMLPEGFSIRRPQGGGFIELYYDNGIDLIKMGFYDDNLNEKNEVERIQHASGGLAKTTVIDDNLYTLDVYSKSRAEGHGPLEHYGTAERCRTKYWELDRIIMIEGPDDLYGPSNPEEITLYEDSTNRVIGYNPYTNEVYLYVFENGTLTAKDLDDQSEKVIETLKEADTIQFEWHDTRLYWKYIKDGNEEFGGCHEFN